MSTPMLTTWMKSQKLKRPAMKDAPVFYQNLEEALDIRRKTHSLFTVKTSLWKEGLGVDFSSNDTLSLGSNGRLGDEFRRELDQNPELCLGSSGSRIMDGNSAYLETVEAEIARFHNAETGLLLSSGFEANLAIFSAIARAGDVIVYDELVHASTHDGMEKSPAVHRASFRHNDPESLRDVLMEIKDSNELIRQARRCIIIAVESIYSMDGDICPLRELRQVSKEIFPQGNAQFVIDEAHSTGVLGPKGAGLVSSLGLEKEIAVRLHTFGKAVSCSGAIVLGNQTIKDALVNFARSVIYTTAPSRPNVAAVRSAYRLMSSGETDSDQQRVQTLTRYVFTSIDNDPVLQEALDREVISVPVMEQWQTRPVHSHIIPIWTKHSFWLAFHLSFAGYCTFPVEYPTVGKGQARVRVALHSGNTEEQIDGLIAAVRDWTTEMMDIEDGKTGSKLPRAARKVYALMSENGVNE